MTHTELGRHLDRVHAVANAWPDDGPPLEGFTWRLIVAAAEQWDADDDPEVVARALANVAPHVTPG